MNQGIVFVWETEEELRERMRWETDSLKRTRLQMLWLLVKERVQRRKELAEKLGVNKEVVGDWIRAYEAGGIEGLLKVGKAGGSESSLPAEVIEKLKQKLKEAEGFKSYKEIVKWVSEACGIETTYWVVYYTVREKLGGRLAVARRSHVKKKLKLKLNSKQHLSDD